VRPPTAPTRFNRICLVLLHEHLRRQDKQLRLSVLSLFFLLAACSGVANLPQPATNNPPALSAAKVVAALKTVATEAKLEPPLETSAPMEASAMSSTRWIICLRSGASEESKRRTYSVFFNNDDYVSARVSVVIEPCGAQVFTALK
jgi:hypothetical protein